MVYITSPDEWYDFSVTLASVLGHTNTCLLFTLGFRIDLRIMEKYWHVPFFSKRLNVVTLHVVATPLPFRAHVHLNKKKITAVNLVVSFQLFSFVAHAKFKVIV